MRDASVSNSSIETDFLCLHQLRRPNRDTEPRYFYDGTRGYCSTCKCDERNGNCKAYTRVTVYYFNVSQNEQL